MRQGKWDTVPGSNGKRIFWMPGHSLSIHDGQKGYYLMDDPRGRTRFLKKKALAGPFPDLESAKVAYIIRMEAER